MEDRLQKYRSMAISIATGEEDEHIVVYAPNTAEAMKILRTFLLERKCDFCIEKFKDQYPV